MKINLSPTPFHISVAALASLALCLVACDSSSSTWESQLNGAFVSAKFKTDSDSDASGTVMEQDTYNGDGTGTTSVLGSLDISLSDTPFDYSFSSIQKFVRELVLPTDATLQETGLLAPDNSTIAFIDNDPSDPIQINLGIGFGFKKANSTPELLGDYETMHIHNSYSTTNFDVTVLTYSFAGSGQGTLTSLSGATDGVTYTLTEDGALQVTVSTTEGQETTTGYVSENGDYFFLVDLNRDDELVGLQIGVKKSSGKSNQSLRGTYHSAHLRNVIAADPLTAQSSVDFDGQGLAIVHGRSSQFEIDYSVEQDGVVRFQWGEEDEDRQGILSPDNNILFSVDHDEADPDDPIISLTIYVKAR